jgi:replication initiation and membrane attachment protein DnaB
METTLDRGTIDPLSVQSVMNVYLGKDIDATALGLYSYLHDRLSGRKSQSETISQQDMKDATNLYSTTFQRAVWQLEGIGVLRVDRRYRGARETNTYHLV